jgi:mannose-6-phosphate isomerase-like protein (cupin superfamily)
MPAPLQLARFPLHLGRGATAIPQPEFTGFEWYDGYGARHGDDGAEGRLVSMHSFAESWDSWEMHPAGDEVVVCVAGSMVITQEFPDGTTKTVALEQGDYAINAPGVWHTADVEGEATALFITVGLGTRHRPR